MALGKEKKGGNYITLKPSIGRLAIKSDQGDPEARPRTYKDSKTNQDVTVYERRTPSLDGYIVGVMVDTSGEYGSQLKITVRDVDMPDFTFPVPLNKSWGTKIAERIPGLKLDEKVFFRAYGDWVDEKGKKHDAGVSVQQNGEKMQSHFNYQVDGKWTRAEGYPEYPAEDTIPDKSKNPAKYTKFWSDYYFTVEEYLIDWFEKNMTIEYVPLAKVSTDDEAVEVPF